MFCMTGSVVLYQPSVLRGTKEFVMDYTASNMDGAAQKIYKISAALKRAHWCQSSI